jgi:dipeptidyl aminopeptidase/acylaminoacyl peptidase
MQTPQQNTMGYLNTSLLTKAQRIPNNRLLLIHGTGDDNVHFQNSVQMVEV